MRLLRFWQKSCLFRYAFLLQYKNDDCLLTFCLDNIFGKNQVLELRSSNLKTNQNTLFFKLQYLTNKLSYIYDVFGIFWMWLKFRESNKYQLGVVRDNWTCPKWWKIVNQLNVKNNLSYEVSFLYVVRNQYM